MAPCSTRGTVRRLAMAVMAAFASAGLLDTANAATTTYVPLSISGTPATSVVAGSSYRFQPTTSGGSGTKSFSVSNKPSWASFSISSGTLSGTPSAAQVGTTTGITISVKDSKSSAKLAPFSITVSAASNTPPTISGTPATTVVAGSAYSFKPTAADANGDTLTFNIAGTLPTWLKFSTSSGLLGGTPTAAGTAGPFTISVSDGKGGSASLPPFSISVSAPATGSATLNWTPPTQNTDGTALADLAGYRVYYGTSATTLTSRVDIAQPATTQYTVSTLATGTWYFAVSAYNLSGTESALSNVGSKTIP